MHLRALILTAAPITDASYCNIVDKSTSVMLKSSIGLDPLDPLDQKFIKAIPGFAEDDEQFKLYTKCISKYCYPAIQDNINSGPTRATEKLWAGLPKFNNPNADWPSKHAKQIVVMQSIGGAEVKIHTMHVVIKGGSTVHLVGLFCQCQSHPFSFDR